MQLYRSLGIHPRRVTHFDPAEKAPTTAPVPTPARDERDEKPIEIKRPDR